MFVTRVVDLVVSPYDAKSLIGGNVFVGGIFAVVGLAGISTALVVLGLLSRRLGQVTRAPRYYLGFFVAAVLIGVSICFDWCIYSNRLSPLRIDRLGGSVLYRIASFWR